MGFYWIRTGIYDTINTCSWHGVDMQRVVCLTWKEICMGSTESAFLFVGVHTHLHACYQVVVKTLKNQKLREGSCKSTWPAGSKGFDVSWLLHSDSQAAVNSSEWRVCVTASKDDFPTGSRKFGGEVSESSVTWEVLHRKRRHGAPSGVIMTKENNKISKEKVNSCSCVCFFCLFLHFIIKNKSVFLYFTIHFEHPHRGSINHQFITDNKKESLI